MRGRDQSKVPPAAAADLMVCFPSRPHLSLLPNPICSPARPSDQPSNRHRYRRKSSNRGQASPQLWAKTRPQSSDALEPTSPKVTCAGQIKVRPKATVCRNWQSVMEEIERIHNQRNERKMKKKKKKKKKKRSAWIEALGFKKDVMQFLTCLRNIRFDFGCFGSFPTAGITSDDEGEEDVENRRKSESKYEIDEEIARDSGDVFSKWFMILQENQGMEYFRKTVTPCLNGDDDNDEEPDRGLIRPPANALLLMRCRSAPANSIPEERKQRTVVMKYRAELSENHGETANEDWLEEGIRNLISRSRSWRR